MRITWNQTTDFGRANNRLTARAQRSISSTTLHPVSRLIVHILFCNFMVCITRCFLFPKSIRKVKKWIIHIYTSTGYFNISWYNTRKKNKTKKIWYVHIPDRYVQHSEWNSKNYFERFKLPEPLATGMYTGITGRFIHSQYFHRHVSHLSYLPCSCPCIEALRPFT